MVRCVYLDHTGDRFFDIGLGVRGCGRNIGRFFDRVKNKNVKNTKMRKQLIFDLDFQNVKSENRGIEKCQTFSRYTVHTIYKFLMALFSSVVYRVPLLPIPVRFQRKN